MIMITGVSQPNSPENGQLYKDDILPVIYISIDPDTLEWLYQQENLESNIEFSARFIFDNGEIIDTIDPVGFRLRGNTSRYSQKKSFKVSFNRFTSGRKYYGVEKLNLNGEHNDPSVMRSKVCWDILRKMNVPAPRSNHVKVYINDNYYGLYISVEHIDEEFIKSRFGYDDGNLYKCLWPADLNYLGDNPNLYKFENGNRRAYALKTNKEADDYTGFANFINILNNSPSSSFACDLGDVFNIYDYLKVISADILFGNWDGYIYNKNNFYLYHNSSSGKMEFIPYDLDNTLGIDWVGRDWATRNIYDWQQHGDNYRPLYQRIIADEDLKNQYSYFMNKLVYETLNLDSLISSVSQRRDMIASSVEDDPYYPLDYGYTLSDFYDSFYQGLGGHVDYGLFPYLQTRISSIKSQLESTSMNPVIKYINNNRLSNSEVTIRAMVIVQEQPASVSVEYEIDGIGFTSEMMYDDGQHYDDLPNDNIYGCIITDIPDNSFVKYQIKVSDNAGKVSLLPCEPILIPAAGGDDAVLFINEFMASNETTIKDEHGDYNDWIEIYNPEDFSVWLGDKYLTDNITVPDKWQLPDKYIAPSEFIIIWADDDTDQGEFHANFKLSKNGEEIGLFKTGGVEVDNISYGSQTTDVSFGRVMDGNPVWISFQNPTPGASNQTSSLEYREHQNNFTIYPNPASGNIVRISKFINFSVYNIYGQIVDEGNNYDFINIASYNKGVYVVVSNSGIRKKLIIN